MKKRVNIKSPNVLYVFTPPMSGVFNNHEMTTGDIKNCLLQGAYVEEILSDGSTIRLDLNNFDKVNDIPKVQPEIKKVIETPKNKVEVPKQQEKIVVEEPVIPETKVEETVVIEELTNVQEESATAEERPVEVDLEQGEQKQQNNYENRNKNYNKKK